MKVLIKAFLALYPRNVVSLPKAFIWLEADLQILVKTIYRFLIASQKAQYLLCYFRSWNELADSVLGFSERQSTET